MIGITSLLSSIIYILLNKKHAKNEKIFYIFSFFAVCYGFVISAMKLHLGYYKENLFESFWDIQLRTYIHYGVPMIAIAILMPITIKVIFKESGLKLIRLFDSCACFSFFWCLFYVRKLGNKAFCITFLISILLTFVAFIYRRREKVDFALDGGYKEQLKKLIPVLAYWIVTIVIYSPNELYLTNADDFPMSYWYFFGKLFISSIFIFVISLVICMVYLTLQQLNLLCNGLFAVLTMGYIQGMFLNGNMSDLDGDVQTWEASKMVINLVIWFIVIAVFLTFSFWKKTVAEKVIGLVSIWLVLIQVVSLGTLIITSDDTENRSGLELTTNGMLEIGEQNNIFMFVLDKFDGRIMDEVLDDDPDFLEPLNDFTYYMNATSEFYPTECSIPYLLSGTEYDESNDDYCTLAFANEGYLIKVLADKGYNVGVYTSNTYVTDNTKNVISNFEEGVERKCNTSELVSLMMQTSKYKMAPFISKNYFVYDTSDIYLLTATDELTNIENDLPFYNRLTSKGLSINEEITGGTYKFYHMHGAHPPYIMTDDFQYVDYDWRRDDGYGTTLISQAKGSMKVVYEYIRQLKALGKYDDATIIITADHGTAGGVVKDNGESIQQSLPILFVKMPYTTSDEITISMAPVAHEDLITTIKSVAGIDVDSKIITDYGEEDDRVRVSRVKTDNFDIKYEIDGNVRDVENWNITYDKSLKN
jgi:hypothetical protein